MSACSLHLLWVFVIDARMNAQWIVKGVRSGLEIDLLAKTEAEGFTPVSAIHDSSRANTWR